MRPKQPGDLTRRGLLAGTLAAVPARLAAQPKGPNAARALAGIVSRIAFRELPEVPVKHAKMILASTLASAAAGRDIGSARIIRELAKEQGGKPEASLWFDG